MMEQKKGLTYKEAGVDTKEGERAVDLMKEHVKKTFNDSVLTGLGGFGSLFKLDVGAMKEPVLVSGTDGVGTKLKLAFMMDRHDTVGIDCVAMCVNDVLCQGAKPLFFLDYIATGKVAAEKIADIVKGVAEGCRLGKSALVGGETAEMPGFYGDDEYDMAGFSVGITDRDNVITGADIKEGNAIIGIASSGLHSNGYSLARKAVFEMAGYNVDDYVEELGETVGEAMLRPTRIYAAVCDSVYDKYKVNGVVHITGGGFYENIPRILPKGIAAKIELGSWEVPPVITFVKKCGNVSTEDLIATFNMGIGMMMFVDKEISDDVISVITAAGEKAWKIGEAVQGEGVEIC